MSRRERFSLPLEREIDGIHFFEALSCIDRGGGIGIMVLLGTLEIGRRGEDREVRQMEFAANGRMPNDGCGSSTKSSDRIRSIDTIDEFVELKSVALSCYESPLYTAAILQWQWIHCLDECNTNQVLKRNI